MSWIIGDFIGLIISGQCFFSFYHDKSHGSIKILFTAAFLLQGWLLGFQIDKYIKEIKEEQRQIIIEEDK